MFLSSFTGMGPKRAILSVKAKGKVVPILLTKGAGKGRFAKLRVRTRATRVTEHDITRGRLRSEVDVMAKSVGRTTRQFGPTFFSIVAAGPPCVLTSRKLQGPSSDGTVTQRRILYALSSVLERDVQLLRSGNEFCVVREPFQLARVLAGVRRCGVRPGQVRFVRPCVSGRPAVILIRKVHKTGPEIAVRPPVVVCTGSKALLRGGKGGSRGREWLGDCGIVKSRSNEGVVFNDGAS